MASGIYAIIGPKNKTYIGSATHIQNRWRKHKSELRRNMHTNGKLQKAWNKYGEFGFTFTVLEIIEDTTKLLHYEQIWLNIVFTSLDIRNEVLNICKTAGNTLGVRHTEKSKRKISLNRRGIKPQRNVEAYSKAQSLAQKISHANKYGLYAFISPNNEIYTDIFDIALFAKQHNLNVSNLRVVAQGKRKHHKGWKKYEIK